jgi:hypothetical protein
MPRNLCLLAMGADSLRGFVGLVPLRIVLRGTSYAARRASAQAAELVRKLALLAIGADFQEPHLLMIRFFAFQRSIISSRDRQQN